MWKLVPVEPTAGMLSEAGEYADHCAIHNYGASPDADGTWVAMLAASPDPATDEALVEREARAICETLFGPYDPASAGPNLMFTPEAQSLRAARAFLAKLKDRKNG